MRVPKSEDEHLELVGGAAETHSGLRKIAFKLRLKRELQLLDITDPEPAERRGPLGEVRRDGKVIDVEWLRR